MVATIVAKPARPLDPNALQTHRRRHLRAVVIE
jgi:hypothetical protein